MIKNFTELEQALSVFPDDHHFIYIDELDFERDNIVRNGIFLVNKERTELVSSFLYAIGDELISTGSAFQLYTYGKNFVSVLLELIQNDCDRTLSIRERFSKTCEGEWTHSKDLFVVSKVTHSYTIWAINNQLRFKSENLNFLLHLIPDLKFLIKKCREEGIFVLI